MELRSTVLLLARKSGFDPFGECMLILLILRRLALVIRNADLGSKVHFQITERGLKRLGMVARTRQAFDFGRTPSADSSKWRNREERLGPLAKL
jgi:hypothetical protein